MNKVPLIPTLFPSGRLEILFPPFFALSLPRIPFGMFPESVLPSLGRTPSSLLPPSSASSPPLVDDSPALAFSRGVDADTFLIEFFNEEGIFFSQISPLFPLYTVLVRRRAVSLTLARA